jgi:A/G-specific adenine glycosylase
MSKSEIKNQTKSFKKAIHAFRTTHGLRDLPWRTTSNPYHIAVSELMLQQTQVPRVIEKYKLFIKTFPTVRALARAPLSDVLILWSGLGYNRRAKFLHAMAKNIVEEQKGVFPRSIDELQQLPGIGPYTARAIAAFAYNTPSSFIETNIRTVYIHHFFKDKEGVTDRELLPIIEATLDIHNSREWYWLLMDYGSFLKAKGIVTHRKSTQYTKQSTFKGSRREVRGAILKTLIAGPKSLPQIVRTTSKEKDVVMSVLGDLLNENLIQKEKQTYFV